MVSPEAEVTEEEEDSVVVEAEDEEVREVCLHTDRINLLVDTD